jgi:hypothetical protein
MFYMHGSTIFALASLCGTCEKYLLILKFWPYNCRGTFFAFAVNCFHIFFMITVNIARLHCSFHRLLCVNVVALQCISFPISLF